MKGVEGMEAQFLTGGDRSLYVKLGDEISLEVNGRVKSLMQKLEADPVDGPVRRRNIIFNLTDIDRFQSGDMIRHRCRHDRPYIILIQHII